MGFRIPVVALSPYARRGHVDHTIYGFESILKMIEYRFGAQAARRAATRYAQQHRALVRLARQAAPEPPELPRPEHVVSLPCAVGGSSPARPKEHDLVELVTSGYLDSLGFEFKRGDLVGRLPDARHDQARAARAMRAVAVAGGRRGHACAASAALRGTNGPTPRATIGSPARPRGTTSSPAARATTSSRAADGKDRLVRRPRPRRPVRRRRQRRTSTPAGATRTRIDCGDGIDIAIVDVTEDGVFDCETVHYPG